MIMSLTNRDHRSRIANESDNLEQRQRTASGNVVDRAMIAFGKSGERSYLLFKGRRGTGFTLIELLVVIAIIAVLAAPASGALEGEAVRLLGQVQEQPAPDRPRHDDVRRRLLCVSGLASPCT
jgi:prepilin-type N-terminal cleavage/methylation domain-containing protein